MKKKFYPPVFLFQLLFVAIKPAFRKIPALSDQGSPEFGGSSFDFNKQTSFETAHSIAPLLYKVFNPLTAACLT
jgi:hypothetical protein